MKKPKPKKFDAWAIRLNGDDLCDIFMTEEEADRFVNNYSTNNFKFEIVKVKFVEVK